MKTVWFLRFKIIFHILLGLLLGSCIAMMYLSSTQRFKDFVQMQMQEQVAKEMGLQLHCNVEAIDFLSCRVQLSNVYISDFAHDNVAEHEQPNWSIMVEKMTVKGSWLSVLLHRCLKVSIIQDHLIMMESFDTTPVSLPAFLEQVFAKMGSSFVVCDNISVRDGLIYLKRLRDGLYIQMPFVCNAQCLPTVMKVQTYLRDGMVWYQDGMTVEKISGSCVGQIPYRNILENVVGDIAINYVLSKADIKIPGFIAGSMRGGYGDFSMKTEDGSISIDPISIECKNEHCWCSMRVLASPDIFSYFHVPEFVTNLSGFVGVDVSFDVYNIFDTLQISVVLQELLYNSKSIMPGGKLTIQDHNKQSCSGLFCMNGQDMMKVDIKVSDTEQTIHVENIVALEFLESKALVVHPHDGTIDIVRGSDGNVKGTYQLRVHYVPTEQQYFIAGSFYSKDGNLYGSGVVNDFSYQHELQFSPELLFTTFQFFNKEKSLVVDISADASDHNYIEGSVDFSVIQQLVPEVLKMSFAQEGSFVGRGYMKDGICHGMIQTHYAHIRVPYVYNVIQNFQAACDIDFYRKNIVLKDIFVQCYEGTMACQRATFWFDNNLHCTALHAPIIFDKVMMSWQKGIYGLLSGRILVSKYADVDPYHVEGKLFLHKAEIRENILSAQFHEMMQAVSSSPMQGHVHNVTFDIGILMHDALSIKTSFMSAKAMIELIVSGTLQKPIVAGAVDIVEGTLHFPYKPLSIVGGKVLLVPEQPLDPVIELKARGKLKRYNVSIHAWGTALDPHIQFEAQPHLTEEQILSLLMLGVEDQSWGLMVPAFLTQKLQEIMFGPALSKIKLKSVFDRILQSLKYIRFLPQFTSQAERGGMRGIFEIDASERLHGKIDTNFTHIEDTRFDVDYDVTDDMTLRLQKDGPSTYGGEVEFSWKFS